jgi:predicted  nucleic acid-binding Zn-ribbon protein
LEDHASMIPALDGLVRLQRVESELRKVDAEIQEGPRLKDELAAQLTVERARLDAAREELALTQKNRRQLEGELQELEGKRSKYKGQLMEVKTNKEYTAMLHEIEGVEREIRGREDRILEEMERAETLAGEVKREEAAFKDVEARQRVELTRLEQRGDALRLEAERLGSERDAVAATLDGDTLELFRRVARLRGVAVAEARDAMCQLCHVALRPQMYMDLKRNEQLIQCPSCNRILYYVVAAAPVASPEA